MIIKHFYAVTSVFWGVTNTPTTTVYRFKDHQKRVEFFSHYAQVTHIDIQLDDVNKSRTGIVIGTHNKWVTLLPKKTPETFEYEVHPGDWITSKYDDEVSYLPEEIKGSENLSALPSACTAVNFTIM